MPYQNIDAPPLFYRHRGHLRLPLELCSRKCRASPPHVQGMQADVRGWFSSDIHGRCVACRHSCRTRYGFSAHLELRAYRQHEYKSDFHFPCDFSSPCRVSSRPSDMRGERLFASTALASSGAGSLRQAPQQFPSMPGTLAIPPQLPRMRRSGPPNRIPMAMPVTARRISKKLTRNVFMVFTVRSGIGI